MDAQTRSDLVKVPAVTLGFWIVKILATTLGETGGDSVSMTWLGETTPQAGVGGMNGYLVGTAIFGAFSNISRLMLLSSIVTESSAMAASPRTS